MKHKIATRIVIVLAVVSATAIAIGYQQFRPEQGYRRTLSYLLYRQPCDEPPPIDQPANFVVDFYGMKYKGRTDNLIDFRVILYGAFEKPILYFLRDAIKASGPGGVFVDVGANTGQHSLFMSQYAHEVHAFEPYQPVLDRFYENIAINHITNIHVHPVGLSDKADTAPFFEPSTANLGSGSFLGGFGHGNATKAGVSLQLVVGDQVFKKFGIARVDVVKIDIEGYEKHALSGLQDTIAQYRPIIDVELTIDPRIPDTFHSEDELLSVLPNGYELLMFDPDSIDYGLGHYKLKTFDINFRNKSQYDVVAFPSAKEVYIPRSYPR